MNRFGIVFGFLVGLVSWLVASTLEVLRQEKEQSYNVRCANIIKAIHEQLVQNLDALDREFRGLEIDENAITGGEIIGRYDMPLVRIREDLDALRIAVEKQYQEALFDIIYDYILRNPEDIFSELSKKKAAITAEMKDYRAMLDRKPGDRSGIRTVS